MKSPELNFRSLTVTVGVLVTAASLLTVIGTWAWNWKFGLPQKTDLVARINTVVAAWAYGAAMIAVVFALIAYWQASGRPSLKPRIVFDGQGDNNLTFQMVKMDLNALPQWVNTSSSPCVDTQATYYMIKRLHNTEILGHVFIENRKIYAARNPG